MAESTRSRPRSSARRRHPSGRVRTRLQGGRPRRLALSGGAPGDRRPRSAPRRKPRRCSPAWPLQPPGAVRQAARRRRRTGQAGSGRLRARRAAAPPLDRRPDGQPRRRRRIVAHAPAAARANARKTCGPTAASGTSGRPPADRASRSRKSTTPRSCARSRALARRPSSDHRRRARRDRRSTLDDAGDAAGCSTSSRIRPGSRS